MEYTNQELTPTETEPNERPERQAVGKAFIPTFSTPGEKEPPKVISTEHRRPEPRPPHWRQVQAVNAEHQKLLAQAEEARKKAREIERHFEGLERRLDSIAHVVELKTRELRRLFGGLEELDPVKLKARLELAFWRRHNSPGDPMAINEWNDVGTLRANAKEARSLIEGKISQLDAEIASMESEKSEIQKKLSDAGVETE